MRSQERATARPDSLEDGLFSGVLAALITFNCRSTGTKNHNFTICGQVTTAIMIEVSDLRAGSQPGVFELFMPGKPMARKTGSRPHPSQPTRCQGFGERLRSDLAQTAYCREGGIGENRLGPVFVLGLTAFGSSGGAARPKTPLAFCRTWVLSVRSSAIKKGPRKGAVFNGGEGGIRTHGTLASTPHFECGTFNHSATSPQRTDGLGIAARMVETARNVDATRARHKA